MVNGPAYRLVYLASAASSAAMISSVCSPRASALEPICEIPRVEERRDIGALHLVAAKRTEHLPVAASSTPSATERTRMPRAIASTAAITPCAPTSIYRSDNSERPSFMQSTGRLASG